MFVGQLEVWGGKFFVNLLLFVGDNVELYSFVGMSYCRGCFGCFYCLLFQSCIIIVIYFDGIVFCINFNIIDCSFGVGICGMIGDWNVDLSIVYGFNEFLFNMINIYNVIIGSSFFIDFDVGGYDFI